MKKYFITGLILLVPILVTLLVIRFLVNTLTNPFSEVFTLLENKFNLSGNLVDFVGTALILLFLFFTIVLVGVFTRWFVIQRLIQLSDFLIGRIPIVNKVYKTTQELLKTVFSPNKNSFKKVVMVPFPKDNCWMLGLIASQAPEKCGQATGQKDLVTVLIPTTPNPTTGFLVMYPKSQIIELDMKIEDAVKYTVSCGVVVPPTM